MAPSVLRTFSLPVKLAGPLGPVFFGERSARLEITVRSPWPLAKSGDSVRAVGFGTFSVADRAAKEGRNPNKPPPTSLSWFEGVGITLCMRLDHQLRFIVDVPPVGDLVLGDDPVAPCLLGPVKSAVGTGDEPRHPLAGIVPPDPDGNVDLP